MGIFLSGYCLLAVLPSAQADLIQWPELLRPTSPVMTTLDYQDTLVVSPDGKYLSDISTSFDGPQQIIDRQTNQVAYYSMILPTWRRLIRRAAFFFSTRRSSLFEMNHRLRRTVLRIPLFTTFFRKRLSRPSCDSFGRKTTLVTVFTSLLSGNAGGPNGLAKDFLLLSRKTRPAEMHAAECTQSLSNKIPGCQP